MRLFLSTALAAAVSFSAVSAFGDTVELTNGDTLTGLVIEQTDEQVELEHPALGRVTVPREQVEAVTIDAEQPAEGTEAEAEAEARAVEQAKSVLTGAGYTVEPPAEEEPPNPGLELGPVTLFEGWDRRFEVGITGSEGNTENRNIRVGLSGFYEDTERRWFVDMAYYNASSGGTRTQNEAYAQITRDLLLPEKRHFYFATGRYDWDEFQAWDHRLSGAGGIGYQFVKTEDFDLLGRAGVGGNQTFGGPDDEFTPEGLLGINLLWDITNTQSLRFANTFYPDLSNLNHYRNITRAEWQIDIDAARNLALKVGAENEHQSNPDGNAEKNDLNYYLNLVLDF